MLSPQEPKSRTSEGSPVLCKLLERLTQGAHEMASQCTRLVLQLQVACFAAPMYSLADGRLLGLASSQVALTREKVKSREPE